MPMSAVKGYFFKRIVASSSRFAASFSEKAIRHAFIRKVL